MGEVDAARWQDEEMPDYSAFEAMMRSDAGGLGAGYRQSRALMKAKSRIAISDLPSEVQVRVKATLESFAGGLLREVVIAALVHLHTIPCCCAHGCCCCKHLADFCQRYPKCI